MFEIITDASLRPEDAEALGVHVLPTPFENSEKLITSFAEKSRPVLFMTISSYLCSNYRDACTAAKTVSEKFPDSLIHVFDTKCISFGEIMAIQFAVKQKESGDTLGNVLIKLGQYTDRVCHLFTVGTDENSSVLMIDEIGNLITCRQAKTRKEALLKTADIYKKTAENSGRKIIVAHAENISDASFLAGKCSFFQREIEICELDSICTDQTGEGTVGLFYRGNLKSNPLL